jgi:hypothetical protein
MIQRVASGGAAVAREFFLLRTGLLVLRRAGLLVLQRVAACSAAAVCESAVWI